MAEYQLYIEYQAPFLDNYYPFVTYDYLAYNFSNFQATRNISLS